MPAIQQNRGNVCVCERNREIGKKGETEIYLKGKKKKITCIYPG